MESNPLAIAIAFAAGIITFLSPCVLPLVPSYLVYIAGVAATKSKVTTAALGFVLGLSLVFALLGATASLVGQTLLSNREILQKLAGVIIVIFGLNLLGLIRFVPLFRSYRAFEVTKPGGGLLTSILVGAAFGVTWTPCVGLQLGAIFLLAAQETTVLQGAFLLFVFGLGLGLPFVLAGLAIERFRGFQLFLSPHLEKIEKIGGISLVILGLLVLTGNFSTLTQWLISKLGTGLVR